MIRCRQVAWLASSGELSDSPLRTRVAVRLHLMMCRHCRRFVRQLVWMGEAARELARRFERDQAVNGLEARLLKRLGVG